MFTVAIRFYLTSGGILAIIGILLRMTWQTSRMVEAFHHHVKESDEKFADQNGRLTYLERRRR
jgi:hypothetical protein